jgi:putative CocE/NonD family hydrolase
VGEIQSSALLFAGWFDPFLDAMITDFQRMRTAGSSEAARSSRLVIGPWTHRTESRFRSTDFGEQARFLGQIKTILGWYDYWLKGVPNGVDDEDPIRIFVMGRNAWRSEREWPLARTRFTPLYLHGGGGSGSEGGRLLTRLPGEDQAPDLFTYDPGDPVPSLDQNVYFGEISYEPDDLQELETRDDVLVYTTGVLPEDLEVTGPVRLILYASSSAPDTDFTARLTDVHPDGRSIHVTSGILRARFRDSLSDPSLLEPGKVYRYEIELGATSNLFRRGHRLRVQISSSDFPRHDRNLNTGAEIGRTGEFARAEQRVFHDSGHPSHLMLPVIPPAESASSR